MAHGLVGQGGEAVAPEHEGAGADEPGHPHAGREQLEEHEGEADDEQEVGHRRAGDGVQQLAGDRELAEAGLRDGLALGLLALGVHDLALHPRQAEEELPDVGRGVVHQVEVAGLTGAHVVAHGGLAAEAAPPERGCG